MGGRKLELAGRVFGKLTVIGRGSRARYWTVRCECGREYEVFAGHLTMGRTKACGCMKRDMATRQHHRAASTVHGHGAPGRHSLTYKSWISMRARCNLPETHKNYKWYGGKGIVVCDRWRTFENFLADMGERPSKGHTIDRKDGDKSYEPGNCRWATWSEQANNRSSSVVSTWTFDQRQEILGRLEHGESQRSVATRFGVNQSTISGLVTCA